MGDDSQSNQTGERIGRGVGAVAGVGIAALSGEPHLGGAIVVGTTELGGVVGAALAHRVEKREPVLIENMARGSETTKEKVRESFRDPTPDMAENILETVRAMMNAVDDAVVPALGMLAGRYRGNNKPPDQLFRAIARTLSDRDAGEFEILRRIMRAVADVGEESLVLNAMVPNQPHAPVRGIGYGFPSTEDPWKQLQLKDEPAYVGQRWKRLFHLLRTQGLGEEYRGRMSFDGSPNLSHLIMLHREMVEETVACIDPVRA